MTTPTPSGNTSGGGFDSSSSRNTGSSSVPSNFGRWDEYLPKKVTMEDSLSESDNARIWDQLYKYAGMSTASEKEKMSIRAGVYVYCVLNGTSREGNYSGTIQLSNGQLISSSVIPRAASKMKIRKFLRTNMTEAYEFLKQTRVMESHERFVAAAAKHGISPEDAFATADFLTECPEFTPSESKAHSALFSHSIERAKRAREGKTLEQIEDSRVDDELTANGPIGNSENGLSHW